MHTQSEKSNFCVWGNKAAFSRKDQLVLVVQFEDVLCVHI